jgi:hypothetical protein
MSSTLIKRSLGVAGVTGGLLLVGAGVALADDSPVDSFGFSQSEAEASAPISLGGVDLGLSTQSSDSSGSSTTTTTDDGSVAQTTEDSSQTSSDLGLNVGEIAVDPSAVLSGVTTEGDDAQGGAAVAAPVSVGAIDLTGSTTTDTTSAQESTVTDQDGSSATEGSASTDSSTTTGTLGLDGLSLDPAAALDGSSWDSGDQADGSVDLTSPVNLGGITAGVTDEREGTDQAWTERTDADGDSTWDRTASEHASATSAGIATGELTADPAAWLAGSTSTDGRDEASGDLGVVAPIGFGGLDGWLTDERASRTSVVEGVRTDDVTRQSTSERADASRTGGMLGLGETTLVPELTGTGSTEDGDRSNGALDLVAPLDSEGAWLSGAFASASDARDTDSVTTSEGTTETSTWSSTSDAAQPSLATGTLTGDPAGWFWGELTQD